jgi:DNA-binding transcriptional MerR regulator
MLSTRDDGLITYDQAAQLARVRPGTIRQWVARGHLAKAGLDERGRCLFRPADVAATEKRLRKPARRIIIPRDVA